MAAGSKTIIAIGIAVAIVLFVGPLGSIGPWMNDLINSFFRQGEDTSSEPVAGAEAGSQGGDISDKQSPLAEGSDGNVSEKESTDGEVKVGEQKPEEAKQVKDTDGDGLSDEEEERVGTDREKPDTDDDGIKDRDEIDRGTDPSGRNTDGDRLDDGVDAEPTVKNVAFVRVISSKLSIEEDYSAMVGVILGPIVGNINPNTEAARVTIDLVFENIGDDFTSFVKFDGTFKVDGKEVKKIKTEIGKLNIGQKLTKHFSYSVKVSDIPPDAINKIVRHVVEGDHPVFSFEIKNIDFEKF
jgi:hypothetical protein